MNKAKFVALALLVGSLASVVSAAQPVFTNLQPWGFQRGTEVDVIVSGARLSDAQELLFYSPGVTCTKLEVVKDNQVKVQLKLADDCRLGIHALRIRTASGVSDLKTFSVGALPVVAEKEPNSEFDAPQEIEMGCTVNGVVQNEDVDYYVVTAKKGDRITAELEGLRMGRTFFDPYLAILNESRFEVARSDDVALLWQDSLCSLIAPEDGKYILQVRESSFGGNGNCVYRLHVGHFPRPTAVLPAGGKPGEKIQLTWLGDAAGPRQQEITLPADAHGEYELIAKDEQGVAPTPNVVRVVDLASVLEIEPNDDRAAATAFAAPGAVNGVIEKAGDIDHFKFPAKKNQQFDIRVYARKPLRSPLDSVMYVYRANGGRVGGNDDSGGPDSYLRFKAPEDGEFTIAINDHLGAGGENYAYRIEVTAIKPQLTMGLSEKQRYVATTMAVPQGNRAALLVTASRANFGGELTTDIKNLPAGMAFETVNMRANRTYVPVLFSAAADAPLAGALADIVGKPVDEKIQVEGHLNQRTLLVRGRNNRDVWGHDAHRMAVVVSEKVPFSIEIVQPKAPLVRNGSMSLKIIAHREEGFTAAIAVRLLYNPPGVSSSGSISIPASKNEALIPITANSGAEIRTWKIVVTGTSRVGNANVEIATQLADLVVADRFFDFAFEAAASELGQDTEVVVKVTQKQAFEGAAQVELVGLPAGVSTSPMEFNKDSSEIVFAVKVAKNARVGKHKTLACRATITQSGEPVLHTFGGGELRVDKPLPVKVAAKPKPVAKAAPKPAVKVVKRLSRLEQLRLQRKQAAAGGGQ